VRHAAPGSITACKSYRFGYHACAVATYGDQSHIWWLAPDAGCSEPIEGGGTNMSRGEVDPAKDRAAETAAAEIKPGMIVGLGSGTTASAMVRHLGLRLQRESLRFVGVATSAATAALAGSLGMTLRALDDVDALDLNLDGADEIDGVFRMVKGHGGALLHEKIVASAARRRVAIIPAEKRVDRFGTRMSIPVEVSPFGLRHIERALRDLGAATTLRTNPAGAPFVTDGGHQIIDCHFAEIDDPEALEHRLKLVAGVFETGFFIGLCDLMIVGHPDRVETIERPRT
jgi:ribose 5-phosphate isomerase A